MLQPTHLARTGALMIPAANFLPVSRTIGLTVLPGPWPAT